ncbi:alpha/beta fold hydrolase [Petropleomorpha daqingensis]|uniref:Alpha-beta hydrolase superfamily lysophospholipase n=1 Tax=Petropleomorpha daqingensis TaxID=2026353 RepID=A0A853CKT4_9ACTN|nr:alpha-beta hydrolase superfamily lysophospholipase [Petropleomorpha daqingensis]
MEKTTSADGTTIAYDAWGDGPAVVIVGGAFNDRNTWAELAQALADRGLRGVSYDRRGRGDSGDTPPYALEREFEDLRAVVDAVSPGAPVFAHGVSSGGALLLRAVEAGAPVARVSVLEPPYRIEGAPPPPETYLATLQSYVDRDDRSGLVEYFQTQVIGLPAEMVASFRTTPMWPSLEALAPTLVYDGHAMGGDDQSLPTDVLGRIGIPLLGVTSEGTAVPWMSRTVEVVADAVPDGRWARLPGGFHEIPPAVLAPVLADFYRG